ncbi:MAG TPA: hypothetical protein VHX12_08175 [Acidisoma sp.]|jgi:hypothetical protein|nr:hypothetical protein [Acidisoma sp.]
MKLIGLALLLATSAASGTAAAASYGCTEADRTAINHNAADPTKPGTIGGCGTGHYKFHKYKKYQEQMHNQNILQGPNRLGTGQTP